MNICFVHPLNIQGPAGRLQAEIHEVPDTTALAILSHPHPLYGGSMHDAVLATMEKALNEMHHSTLRFNFRGVGGSEGEHANGKGEVEDLVSVVQWARANIKVKNLVLAGYSFGAMVTLNAAPEILPDSLILVAPPLGLMDVPSADTLACPVTMLVGDLDEFVPLASLESWSGERAHVSLNVIMGANHFFMGHMTLLADQLAGLAETQE